MKFPKFLWRFLPDGAIYADHLTTKGRRLVRSALVALVAIAAGVVGLFLAGLQNWQGTVSGLLVGSAVTSLLWSFSSYKEEGEDIGDELKQEVQHDLLHARLNLIGDKLGLEPISLRTELDSIVAVRTERLAHMAGLDEHRPELPPGAVGWNFWSPSAMGEKE